MTSVSKTFESEKPLEGVKGHTILLGFLSLLLTAAALGFAAYYAVNWIHVDDLCTIAWFEKIDAGVFSFWDLVNARDNQHFLAAQIVLTYLVKMIFGLNFKGFVYLSFFIIAITASVMTSGLTPQLRKPWQSSMLLVLCFALAFHFSQMEHLIWGYEVGWFMVNACIVTNAVLIERVKKSALLVAMLCLVATYSSAQGALTWFAAAFHYALLSRHSLLRCTLPFSLLGILAVAHIIAQDVDPPHPFLLNVEGIIGFGIYMAQVFGGTFGLQDHNQLLIAGSSLLASWVFLILQCLRKPQTPAFRIGLVLTFVSFLCVLSFAKGRFHLGIEWAVYAFHAAPLFMPFLLGMAALLVAASSTSNKPPSSANFIAAGTALVLLVAGVITAIPYGVARAQLWTMHQGYAMWATCYSDASPVIQARAAGLESYQAEFNEARPKLMKLCSKDQSALAMRLTQWPPLFEKLAVEDPSKREALTLIWQDYATDMGLERFFSINDPQTPRNLLSFVKSQAEKREDYDAARLRPLREMILKIDVNS